MSGVTLRFRELERGVHVWRRVSNGGLVPLGKACGLLVDTGAEEGAARALLGEVSRRGWQRPLVVNTHHHHDHTYGNERLTSEADARVATCHEAGRVVQLIYNLAINCIPVPGHARGAVAVLVRGVLFAGDAVFAPDILRRFPVPAFPDVEAAVASLDRIEQTFRAGEARWLVAGHGEPIPASDVPQALAACRRAVDDALARLREVWRSGQSTAEEPGERAIRAWLEASGTSVRDARALRYWRRVAAGYAAELRRRGHD